MTTLPAEHPTTVPWAEMGDTGIVGLVTQPLAYQVPTELVMGFRDVPTWETDGTRLMHSFPLARICDAMTHFEPVNCELVLTIDGVPFDLRDAMLPVARLREATIIMTLVVLARPDTVGFRARCTFLQTRERDDLLWGVSGECPSVPRERMGVLGSSVAVGEWLAAAPTAYARRAVAERTFVNHRGAAPHTVNLESALRGVDVVDQIEAINCTLALDGELALEVDGEATTVVRLADLRDTAVRLTMTPIASDVCYGFMSRLTRLPRL